MRWGKPRRPERLDEESLNRWAAILPEEQDDTAPYHDLTSEWKFIETSHDDDADGM